MNKALKIMIAIVCTLIVVAAGILVYLNVLKPSDADKGNNFIQSRIVTESLDKLYKDNDFASMSDEDKVDSVKTCLEELEKNDVIKDVEYRDKVFSFRYASTDIESGVAVGELGENETFGNAPSSDNNNIKKTEIKSTGSKKEQKWSMLLGADVAASLEVSYAELSTDFDNGLIDLDYSSQSTVDSFKKFGGKNLVYIAAHGLRSGYGQTYIWTQEVATEELQQKEEYKELIKNGSICVYYTKNSDDKSIGYFVITPSFFENYYKNNELNGAIFVCSVCCMMGDNDTVNKDYYNSLKKAGAKSLIAPCNSVNQGYSLFFTQYLLTEYMNGVRLGDAFEHAKNIIGETQEQYRSINTNYGYEMPRYENDSFFVLQGSDSSVLTNYEATGFGQYSFTVKDDKTDEPIKNALVIITRNDRYAHIYKTDIDGCCNISLPEYEYVCEIKMPEYEDLEFSFKIEKKILTAILDPYYMKKKDKNEKLFNQYIRDNLEIIDYDAYAKNTDSTVSGLISVAIDDFDNDDKTEMITFSNTDENIIISLYEVKNGKVKLCDSTDDSLSCGGAGNFGNNLCIFNDNGAIKIITSMWGFGGSNHGERYISLVVKNDKLVAQKDFMLYEFYRYDNFQYEEHVGNKTYSSPEEFAKAVKAAGFDVEEHYHVGYTDSKFDQNKDDYKTFPEFKGNHILVSYSSESFGSSGIYRFFSDNTDLENRMKALK